MTAAQGASGGCKKRTDTTVEREVSAYFVTSYTSQGLQAFAETEWPSAAKRRIKRTLFFITHMHGESSILDVIVSPAAELLLNRSYRPDVVALLGRVIRWKRVDTVIVY
jgi:hypothetical protein